QSEESQMALLGGVVLELPVPPISHLNPLKPGEHRHVGAPFVPMHVPRPLQSEESQMALLGGVVLELPFP
ncbi:hypothetical protein PENTCL1PPCAC_14918, partial [Pristionchus entomophagus]